MERTYRRGFTRVDTVAIVCLLGVGGATVLPGMAMVRDIDRKTVSLNHMKAMLLASQAYAESNNDLLPTFSAQGGVPFVSKSKWPPIHGVVPSDDMVAAAFQAHDIILTRSGRPHNSISLVTSWIPHVLYQPLVLSDFLGRAVADPMVMDPSNTVKRNWQIDPLNKFDKGFWLPLQPPPGGSNWRWPYSSTYRSSLAVFDKGPVGSRVTIFSSTNLYTVPASLTFAGRTLGEVAFPAHKSWWFAEESFAGPTPDRFFMDPLAVIPHGMFDGSALFLTGVAVNNGACPNTPLNTGTAVCSGPISHGSPPYPQGTTFSAAKALQTRSGLKGRDIGGPEVVSTA